MNMTCKTEDLKVTCLVVKTDLKTGLKISETEETSNAIVVAVPSGVDVPEYLSESFAKDRIVVGYRPMVSKTQEFDDAGVQSSTSTTKTAYNSAYQITSIEEVTLRDKITKTRTESFTYDMGGARRLTRVVVSSEDTVTYTYTY